MSAVLHLDTGQDIVLVHYTTDDSVICSSYHLNYLKGSGLHRP